MQERYVGVYALIISKQRILLAKKTRGPYIGSWDLPGGGIQESESPLQALKRELMEEIALPISCAQTRLWDYCSYMTTYKQRPFFHVGIVYKIRNVKANDVDLHIHQKDVNGAGWLSLQKALDLPLTPFAFSSLEKLHHRHPQT